MSTVKHFLRMYRTFILVFLVLIGLLVGAVILESNHPGTGWEIAIVLLAATLLHVLATQVVEGVIRARVPMNSRRIARGLSYGSLLVVWLYLTFVTGGFSNGGLDNLDNPVAAFCYLSSVWMGVRVMNVIWWSEWPEEADERPSR